MDEAKRHLVRLWLSKAGSDLRSVRILGAAENAPLDTAVYHCQQAAEKALKGFLCFGDIPIRRTHDVEDLVRQAMALEPTFASVVADATVVKPYDVGFRYPSPVMPLEPARAEFDEALAAAQRIHDFVLSLLPPETHPV